MSVEDTSLIFPPWRFLHHARLEVSLRPERLASAVSPATVATYFLTLIEMMTRVQTNFSKEKLSLRP